MCLNEIASLRGPVQTISTVWSASRDLCEQAAVRRAMATSDGESPELSPANHARTAGIRCDGEDGARRLRFGIGHPHVMSRDDLSHPFDESPGSFPASFRAASMRPGTGSWRGPISTQKTRKYLTPDREERILLPVHGGHQDCPIKVLVAPLRMMSPGANRQAWHDAPCSDVPSLPRMVLGTQRVAGTESHAIHRLIQMPLQDARLPERHQPPSVPSLSGAAV